MTLTLRLTHVWGLTKMEIDYQDREEQIYQMRKAGETFSKIASKFNISSSRANQIYKKKKHREDNWDTWPPLRKMLSYRSRISLIRHFQDEDILSKPHKIAEIGLTNMLKIKNLGRYSLQEITCSLYSLGYMSYEELANWYGPDLDNSPIQKDFSNKAGKPGTRKGTGIDQPGVPSISTKPHLGKLLLKKYRDRITTGFDDLEKFELVDRLEKPVLNFIFYGQKKIILDVYNFLSKHPYSFFMKTKRGPDIWKLPDRGTRNAYVYISRFPNLIKFIQKYENEITNDLWGLLYGYPLDEIHQFTYNWEAWDKKMEMKERDAI